MGATPSTAAPVGDGLLGLDDIAAETVEAPPSRTLDDRSRTEADALFAAVAEAAATSGWGDADGARRAGYVPMPGDDLHWYDPDAVADAGAVDPTHPDFLMIASGDVVGVMFLAPSDDGTRDPPVAPGDPIVRWHLHRWSEPVCLGEGGLVVVAAAGAGGACPTGSTAATSSPWMFHVWLVGEDRFAAEMHPADHEH